MAERQSKSDILPHKKTIRLTPAIGDWTTYHPPKTYAKRIKSGLYGFDRLSEERLTKALILHYDFTREFLRTLQIKLMLGSEFYSISGEQTSYINFLRSANYPLLHFTLLLPEWHSAVSVCIDLALVNTIINQSLGSKDTAPLSRKLTDVEESILDLPVKEYFIPFLSQAFQNLFGPTEMSCLSSPDIITDTSLNPSNAFVYFNIEVALADNPPGKIQIGYAGNLLKNILKNIEELPETKPLPLSKLPAELLNSIDVPISVTLGTTEIGTGELQEIESGDVVALDNSLDTPVSIKIGDIINLLGQPGKKGKKIATRIVSLQKEEKIRVQAAPTLEENSEDELSNDSNLKLEEPEDKSLEETYEEEYPKEETITDEAPDTEVSLPEGEPEEEYQEENVLNEEAKGEDNYEDEDDDEDDEEDDEEEDFLEE